MTSAPVCFFSCSRQSFSLIALRNEHVNQKNDFQKKMTEEEGGNQQELEEKITGWTVSELRIHIHHRQAECWVFSRFFTISKRNIQNGARLKRARCERFEHPIAGPDNRIEHGDSLPCKILIVLFFYATTDDSLNVCGQNHMAQFFGGSPRQHHGFFIFDPVVRSDGSNWLS